MLNPDMWSSPRVVCSVSRGYIRRLVIGHDLAPRPREAFVFRVCPLTIYYPIPQPLYTIDHVCVTKNYSPRSVAPVPRPPSRLEAYLQRLCGLLYLAPLHPSSANVAHLLQDFLGASSRLETLERLQRSRPERELRQALQVVCVYLSLCMSSYEFDVFSHYFA